MPLPSAETFSASDIRDSYRRDGYVILRGVFTAAEVAELAAAFDRQYQAGLDHPRSFRHGNFHVRVADDPAIGHTVRMVQWPSYGDAVLNAVRQDRRMLAIVAPLIGTDVKQIINQMHWKPPGAAGGDYAFHQDSRFRRPREAYRNLGGSYVQTGIAVDPHRPESGAMRVYPGSHRMGDLALSPRGSILGTGIAEDALEQAGLDPAKLVDFALEPGDVGLWHPHTIHGSGQKPIRSRPAALHQRLCARVRLRPRRMDVERRPAGAAGRTGAGPLRRPPPPAGTALRRRLPTSLVRPGFVGWAKPQPRPHRRRTPR